MNKINSINFYGCGLNGLKVLGIMFKFYFYVLFLPFLHRTLWLLLTKPHGELLRTKTKEERIIFFEWPPKPPLTAIPNLQIDSSLFFFSLTKGQEGFHAAEQFFRC